MLVMPSADFLTPEQAESFRKTLENYKPSEDLLVLFREVKYAVIAGSTGSGKDTLKKALIDSDLNTYASIVGDISRPLRPSEQDGVEYHFKTAEEMAEGFERGDYLQGALIHNQQVAGLHKDSFMQLTAGRIGVSIIVVDTEVELHDLKPDIRTVFLVPPSLQEMYNRMRHGRAMQPSEETRRLHSAVHELTTAIDKQRYYCILTTDVERTLPLVDQFFKYGERNEAIDAEARQVAREILEQLTTVEA